MRCDAQRGVWEPVCAGEGRGWGGQGEPEMAPGRAGQQRASFGRVNPLLTFAASLRAVPEGCFWQGALAWQAVRPRGCKGLRLGCAWARGLLVARRKGSRLCGLVGGAVAQWQWRHVRAGLAWEWQCAERGALCARGLLVGWRKGDFFQCAGW